MTYRGASFEEMDLDTISCAYKRAWPPRPPIASNSTASLLEDVGGEFHEVAGTDIAAALVDFARAENATQIVVGASQRSPVGGAVARLGDQPRGPTLGTHRRPRHLE